MGERAVEPLGRARTGAAAGRARRRRAPCQRGRRRRGGRGPCSRMAPVVEQLERVRERPRGQLDLVSGSPRDARRAGAGRARARCSSGRARRASVDRTGRTRRVQTGREARPRFVQSCAKSAQSSGFAVSQARPLVWYARPAWSLPPVPASARQAPAASWSGRRQRAVGIGALIGWAAGRGRHRRPHRRNSQPARWRLRRLPPLPGVLHLDGRSLLHTPSRPEPADPHDHGRRRGGARAAGRADRRLVGGGMGARSRPLGRR